MGVTLRSVVILKASFLFLVHRTSDGETAVSSRRASCSLGTTEGEGAPLTPSSSGVLLAPVAVPQLGPPASLADASSSCFPFPGVL